MTVTVYDTPTFRQRPKPWPCAGCFQFEPSCLCPYFHEPRIFSTRRVEPGINHERPNPFILVAPPILPAPATPLGLGRFTRNGSRRK